MKNFALICSFSLVLTFLGCKDKYQYWDITKFNIQEDALKDHEEIKLLYSSRSQNNEKTAYIHLIVVSQLSGDTVNILTHANNDFKESDADKIFNFFDSNNLATKISQLRTDQIEADKIMETAESLKPQKLNKVWRDPLFDHIADNQYPTVFGTVGTFTKNKDN